MKLNDFKIGWRLLIGDPIYSAIVIVGLALGFATCFSLLSYVRYSLQYNANVPDVANVYVVKQRYNIDAVAPWFDQSPYLLRTAAMKLPGVENVSGYDPNRSYPVRIENQIRKLSVLPVLPGFTQLLGFEALEGDLGAALEQPENIAMTAQTATAYFGTAHALGLTLQASGKVLRVAAILRDPPTNTTIPHEALIGVNSVLISNKQQATMLNGNGKGYDWGKLLIRVKPGTSISAVTEALQQAIDLSAISQTQKPEVKQRLGKRKVMDIKLSPLSDAYFDQDIADNPITIPGDRGNPVVVKGLAAIAFLILALAAINYVNLVTVRLLQRQREIGIRKTLGATAQQIFVQFLSESLLVSLLATGLGILLAWLALPLFSELMQRKLDGVFSAENILAALIIGIIVGILTAIYPAWIALHVRPLQVLLGRPNTESMHGNLMRRIMTVLQIAVALSLASITLAIAWQTSFAMNASPGFDPDPLLIVDLPVQVKDNQKAHHFISALTQKKNIASVAVTMDAVGRSKSRFGLDFRLGNNPSIFVEMKSVSANFFNQYRIKPVAGRLFDPRRDKEDDPDPIIINTVAARKFGFKTPGAAIGQILQYTNYDGDVLIKRVIGVAPELRFFSLREAPRAIAWELWTQSSTLSIRASASLTDAEQTIQQLWHTSFPDDALEMYSAKAILATNYEDDARMTKLLAFSTGIAMAISAFGIYALSAHSVQRRAREIVLRKLYGATKRHIGNLVAREIGLLILFSALIGLPLSTLIIRRYLAGYVEHAAIGYWTLLIALLMVVAITLIATTRHILIAMQMKPVRALSN
ncbi:FtsX-like permease family protein [Undibacterium sp. Ji50W]|uniref:FtsX-like permease family protein n=1 Tax=Undibacterium sp. Ji50W TaxID=3413041 RepID=UPI003BF200E4